MFPEIFGSNLVHEIDLARQIIIVAAIRGKSLCWRALRTFRIVKFVASKLLTGGSALAQALVISYLTYLVSKGS